MKKNLMNDNCPDDQKQTLFADLEQLLLRSVPRLLTQLDRDPDSPTFGCFDRDFWHYKIRDFSSIVLQQGCLVLEMLYDFPHEDNFLYQEPKVLAWIDASLGFWSSQQLPSGAFNEYYPFEEGFPPTAFSLFAVGLLCQRRRFSELSPHVLRSIQKAADWLLSVQERQAVNQEVVALTALALVARIPSITVDLDKLAHRFAQLYALQSPEGWFPEYGGADSGYLSVALDALAVYHDLSGDARAENAMRKGLDFISQLVAVSGTTPVMTNSRNTDYIVPYGLVRMGEHEPLARRVVESLFANTGSPDHFLNATDDRYLCHYIYQSCFRCLEHLPRMTAQTAALPCETGANTYLPEAGLHILHMPGRMSLITATRKGGVYYLYTPRGLVFADYGWRHKTADGRVTLTNWQQGATIPVFEQRFGSVAMEICGTVSTHGWEQPTPLRHAVLRILSYLFGRRIIAWLKSAMIFKAKSHGIGYCRQITITETKLQCRDNFSGSGIGTFAPQPAPPYSLRHVASAGNFNREELTAAATASRSVERSAEKLVITSTIEFSELPQ